MKTCFFALLCFLPPLPLHAQHDAQREAVKAVARADDTAYAKAFVNPKVDAGEHETIMTQILLLLSRDEVDDAIVAARGALESGLPPERLLAGSGPLLGALREHPEFSELPGISEVGAIIHGPMLGDVTGRGARIWVRTNGPLTLQAVTVDSRGTLRRTEERSSTAETDYTLEFELEGLLPEDRYEVFIVREEDPPEKAVARVSIETPVEKGESSVFTVAFGGGAGFVPEFHRMWKTISAREPDALLMLGDNVYIDDPEHVLTQRYCYHRRQSEPNWRSLVSKTPVYAIYDDHDFGDNDCMPGPKIDEPAWKRPVVDFFSHNWANPGYGGGEENPGCWFEFSIGDVQFFLLDGRYYRDVDSGSMLGPVQKQWLLDALAASEATFKVVVSPVPFTEGIKGGSKDPWDGYPEEREEIFSWIENKGIDGVFLVAADRHRTDLRTTEREEGYTLYEFMSSRLTNSHVHPVVETPGLIWGYNDTCSFGLMEFDTTADDPKVTFRCVDIDGNDIHEFTLRRGMITRE